jgi:hypothetical protein
MSSDDTKKASVLLTPPGFDISRFMRPTGMQFWLSNLTKKEYDSIPCGVNINSERFGDVFALREDVAAVAEPEPHEGDIGVFTTLMNADVVMDSMQDVANPTREELTGTHNPNMRTVIDRINTQVQLLAHDPCE